MGKADKRKQSLYFPEETLAQIQAHAARLDRSMSWLVQYAWQQAVEKIAQLPSHDR